MEGEELWGYLDGSIKKPNDTKEITKWKANNAKVISWILTFVEPNVSTTLHVPIQPHRQCDPT